MLQAAPWRRARPSPLWWFRILFFAGYLLGGHYRTELFVRCACRECKRLPVRLHDDKDRVKGCVWTVSQWAAHGGRASHKKWRGR